MPLLIFCVVKPRGTEDEYTVSEEYNVSPLWLKNESVSSSENFIPTSKK